MRLPLVLLAVWAATADAQPHRLISADDPAYPLIERMMRRGHLLSLNPTRAPYTEGELREALAELPPRLSPLEAAWSRRLWERAGRLEHPPGADPGLTAALDAAIGTRASSTDRLDPVRPIEAGGATVALGDVNLYPRIAVRAAVEAGPFTSQLGAQLDTYYHDNPDGLDLGNVTAFLRNEESYVGAVHRYADLRAGRIARRWGDAASPPLFVSADVPAYDALALRVGTPVLSAESFVGVLDAADELGRMTGRTGDRSRRPILRRYLAAHRIDWRPTPTVLISGLEALVISGNGAPFPIAALAPTAVYSFLNDGTPKNDDVNSLLGGLFWVQARSVTISGQLLLDDVDLFDAAEPPSVGVSGSVVAAGLGSRVDAGLSVTAVTARTYNTGRPEQTYVYALRGLGLPFNDFAHGRVFADVFLDDLVPGLVLRPELHGLIQGEADFREPILANEAPAWFVGDAERTVRAGVVASAGGAWWWARADLGVNWTRNDGFVRGAEAVRFVGLGEVGVRLRLVAPLPTTW